MRTLLRAAFGAALIMATTACHGQSPMAASAAAEETLTVRSNRTGQPVPGATVTVAGIAEPLVVPSDGIVHLPGVPAGTVVAIEADGYLHSYVTRYNPGRTLYIVPDDEQFPYRVIVRALHSDNPATSMTRISPRVGVVTVFPDDSFRNDPEAWWALQRGVSIHARGSQSVNSVARPGVAPAPGVVIAAPGKTTAEYAVTISYAPDDPVWSEVGFENAAALTYPTYEGRTLVGARIIFKGLSDIFFGDHLWHAVVCELAHARGLDYLPGDMRGMLGPGWERLDGFAPVEIDLMASQLVRPAGKVLVDDDSVVGQASSVLSLHRAEGAPFAAYPVPR